MALIIILSFLKLKILLALIIIPGVLFYMYLITLVLYWLFEFPKYSLKYYLYDIPDLIDEIFKKTFDEEDFSNCKDIQTRLKMMINLNKVPKDKLLFDVWLYKLKIYKDRLVTLVPVIAALIVKSVSILITYYQWGDFLERLLPKDSYYKDMICVILPLAWTLYVYTVELHDTNRRIHRIELLKNLIN